MSHQIYLQYFTMKCGGGKTINTIKLITINNKTINIQFDNSVILISSSHVK